MMLPSSSLLLVLLSTSLAQDTDDKIKQNFISIFGTPDNPIKNDENNIKKNAETIFKPPAPNIPNRVDNTEGGGDGDGDFSLKPSDKISKDCVRDDGKPGICVVYYQCDPETKRLITDGETLIDVRNGKCPHYLDVCCLRHEVNETALRPQPTDAPVIATSAPSGKPDAPVRPCGYSNFGDEEAYRIINDGTLAEFLEFPWMVALLMRQEAGTAWSQKDYLGGGSLIHPRVVLTSAHKIDGVAASSIKIRAGEHDTRTTSEGHPYQERDVAKIIRHDNFYRPSVLNSIALLILSEPVTPAPNIANACLGKEFPAPETRCYSMGWGKDQFNNKDSFANILKKVELPLKSRNDCQNALRRTRLGSYFQLHPSLTCAGGEEGKDTCGGDGGSPLVCFIGEPKDLRYAVYGLVAFGIGCGEGGIPGVYVNVPMFYSWIDEQLKAEGITTDTYKF